MTVNNMFKVLTFQRKVGNKIKFEEINLGIILKEMVPNDKMCVTVAARNRFIGVV